MSRRPRRPRRNHTAAFKAKVALEADNIMSQFNLKRLGFVKEGVFRNHMRTDLDSDTYVDVVYYG